jgi:hypothetical protein
MTTPSLTNRGEVVLALNQTSPSPVGARRRQESRQTGPGAPAR